ncbi:MAG: DUF885 domain-containing protein [Gammaproteobacteria bacterium]|nr:DUF885 domain-containing protein [Gammaproteobacteria bacterium]MDE0247290.1 DUF885 domain-containing protein [Gammaproteobacteria bacterium]
MRILTTVLLLSATACMHQARVSRTNVADGPPTESMRLNGWLDREWEAWLAYSPEFRTRLGDREDYDRLGEVSDAARDEVAEWILGSVARMRSEFDYDLLDAEARTSYDLYEYQGAVLERFRRFRRHHDPIGRSGPHAYYPLFMINHHHVETVDEMRAYVSRLRQIGRAIRQHLDNARAAAADGIRAPRFDYAAAMDEIDRVLGGAPFTPDVESSWWADITGKAASLVERGIVGETQAGEFVAEARRALVEEVSPAYLELREWLEEDMTNAAPEAQGAWALPDGEAYYDYMLFQSTTLDLTAQEIHEIGLNEVDRIREEMEILKTEVGFGGTLQEFFAFVREDPQFYFSDTDEGRQAYLDLAAGYLDRMTDVLPNYFGILPKAGIEVRRVEAFREEDGGAQSYMPGTPDGSRPGVFYVHLSDMRSMPRYQLEGIAYHEGVPGHHLQVSIAQELEDVPMFRKHSFYTAYTEGWALYSEALGGEMGFYEDPYSEFGRLSAEMWRAIRLVVDTGLHAERWTEEEAVQYFMANSPQPEGAVRSEIQRYLTMPGQAVAYKIGMMKIRDLRERARASLGAAFDIREFHDTVLGGGAMPLPVLEARVEWWIAESG